MYLYSSTQVCPAPVNGLLLPYSQLRPSHSVRFAQIHKDGICLSCVDVTKYTTIYSSPVVFLKYMWEYSISELSVIITWNMEILREINKLYRVFF